MAQEPEIDQLETADELIAERRAGKVGDTPEGMHPWMRLIVGNVDILNNWVGRLTCLMLVPVIFAMIYEVVARKVFIAPTDWAYDTSRMFSGAMFMMGAGYALMRGVHIRADFLFRNWSPRTQALVDGALYLLFYFPAMLFFFWVSMEYTIKAWVTWERSMDTALMAPQRRREARCRSGRSCCCCRASPNSFVPITSLVTVRSGDGCSVCYRPMS